MFLIWKRYLAELFLFIYLYVKTILTEINFIIELCYLSVSSCILKKKLKHFDIKPVSRFELIEVSLSVKRFHLSFHVGFYYIIYILMRSKSEHELCEICINNDSYIIIFRIFSKSCEFSIEIKCIHNILSKLVNLTNCKLNIKFVKK